MLKRYSEYKDSGIEWIGPVPKDWSIKRLKFIADVNPPRLAGMDDKTLCVFIPMEAMNSDGTFDQSSRRPVVELKTGFTCFSKDDVIFAKITPCFENGKGALLAELASDVGFGSTEFHVLRKHNGTTIPRFLYYLSISGAFRRLGEAFMQGVAGQKRVTNDFVRDFVSGVPSVKEQKQITDFLFRKTQQIDDLITKKERMIELLKEERAAVINQAMTKGFDSNVEMKDSGVDWMGKVPKAWDVIRLRFLCGITTGGKDTVNREDDGAYPFFVRSPTVERISTYSFDGEAVLTAGDGVGVGKVFHYYNGKFDFHQRVYMFFRFRKVIGRYFYYFLSTNLHRVVCRGDAKSTVDSVRLPFLQDFPVSFPDTDEQERIVGFLDKKLNQIDGQVTREERSIELLKEYRTALISEAVTGRIDVRGEL